MMRPLLYIASFVAVMALAFWAYRENYATQQALRDLTRVENDIAALHEALAIQRAEWAYLNRPDRLRELVTLNFDRLGLLPLEPDQLGNAGLVVYPPNPALQIDDAIDVVGVVEQPGEATEESVP